MINVETLRKNPEMVRASQRARNAEVGLVDIAVELDAQWRQTTIQLAELRQEANQASKKVKEATKDTRAEFILAAKAISSEVQVLQETELRLAKERDVALRKIPNIVLGAPAGGEEDYIVVEEVGIKPTFEGVIKDHVELGTKLGVFDLERGARTSGARFYYMTGIGARLERAIVNLALDTAHNNGFTQISAPVLVRPEAMEGTGFLGEHGDEVYRLEADDLYLVGTSEVPLAAFHAGEILPDETFRYVSASTCFRREAGSHGKDTRGIFRVHQFEKVEMFTFVTPEEAENEHLKLLQYEKEFLGLLELPYRVIDVAAGDLGTSAARKFDCEAWVPSQQKYREVTSTSNCTTFQTTRLKVRRRNADGKIQPVATLNGTLAAVPRLIVALLENHQQPDGSVKVPLALRYYLGGLEIIR